MSLADEARRWFECSTIICRFVPDGEARAAKVSWRVCTTVAAFQTLLFSARYPTRTPIYSQGFALTPTSQRTLNCTRIPDRTPLLGLLHCRACFWCSPALVSWSSWLCGWLSLLLALKLAAALIGRSRQLQNSGPPSCHICRTSVSICAQRTLKTNSL